MRGDIDSQDILALNLTRAVQLCVDPAGIVIADSDEPAPQTMGQAFDTLMRMGAMDEELAGRMKAAVGFRNIAVHNYRSGDWDIYFRSATKVDQPPRAGRFPGFRQGHGSFVVA